METFDAPRGTRDFLPDQMAVRNHVERVVRDTFESFGYQQVQTPTFEQYELLAARSGEEIKESMFTFASDAGRYALRPELTSPVCRIVASGKLKDHPKPYKLYYYGPCFRYCRPQEGRYREFFQAGIELLGSSDPLADAETIAVADKVLKNLAIGEYRLKVGNVGIFRRLLDEQAPENPLQREEWEARVLHDLDRLMGITAKCRMLAGHATLSDDDKEYLAREANYLAALQEEIKYEGPAKLARSAQRTDQELAELVSNLPEIGKTTIGAAWTEHGLLSQESASLILQVAQTRGSVAQVRETATKLLVGTTGERALLELWDVCSWLDALGVTDYEVVLGTVRNLDFYTGTVFEIDSPHLGTHRQLCGGGRYDTLVEDFGGPKTPATGLAFSFDRLVQVFKAGQATVDATAVDVFVCADEVEARPRAVQVAEQLRKEKFRATVDLMNRSLEQQIEYARQTLKAAFAAVVRPADLQAQQCKLIHLASGKEETVPLASLAQEISRIRSN